MSPLCLALVLTLAPSAADPGEQLLAGADVKTDGPGLLAFVRQRVPSEKDAARLAGLVKALADDSFAVREKASADLVAAGPLALPALRPALTDRDLEVARRARQCLDDIEKTPHRERLAAALRLLAARRPSGAAEALLAYAPLAAGDGLEDEALEALAAVGLTGEPKDAAPAAAVKAALEDREPARRAAAAFVLGRAADEARKALVPLLEDRDARVRSRAAEGLLRGGDKRALPVLIALLGEGPPEAAWRAEDLLVRVAGEQAPAVSLGERAEERRKCRDAWRAWWDAKGDKLDLKGIKLDEASLGLTVYCEFEVHGAGPGHARAVGRDGKEVWHVAGVESPTDVHLLPGGRVLIAEHFGKKVTERDRDGKVIWEAKLESMPVACQRLPGGNTFVATREQLLEFGSDGKQVAARPSPSGATYYALRLADGRTLCISSAGQVTELDREGKALVSFKPASYAEGASMWASVEPLPGGRYLLALDGSDRVVETDKTGKILWEATVKKPTSATRLRNGHTLIASATEHCLVEIDASGKEVWRLKAGFRAFRARRY